MSEFEVVVAPKAGRPVGPFSQAVKLKPGASLVFCSGALGRNPADKKLPEGVEAQTRQSLANVRNVLEAAGTSMSNVVKATILLSDVRHALTSSHLAFLTCLRADGPSWLTDQ
ncbi:MAG: hypothetical protein MHM6MM_001767 [Cercozoa sp. M6MM]